MSDPLEILRLLARENARRLTMPMPPHDTACAHWAGVQVRQFVRHTHGVRYEAGSAIYRRARAALERLVTEGKATRWQPGASSLVSYWPIGLAAELAAATATNTLPNQST